VNEEHELAIAQVRGGIGDDVALAPGAVEGKVAGVQDQVRPVGAQRFADAPEGVDGEGFDVAEMGVRWQLPRDARARGKNMAGVQEKPVSLRRCERLTPR